MDMGILTEDWLTSQPIDFEHKQYKLLAYRKEKISLYDDKMVYPSLSDIIQKHKYINDFIKNIDDLHDSTKKVKAIDLNNMKLNYESKINDNNIDEILEIAEYGLDIFNELLNLFKNLYNRIENTIEIVGSNDLQFNHMGGFIVVKIGSQDIFYDFVVREIFEKEKFYSLELIPISEKKYYRDRFKRNIYNIFILEEYPYENAYLPIMKRKFLSHFLS